MLKRSYVHAHVLAQVYFNHYFEDVSDVRRLFCQVLALW